MTQFSNTIDQVKVEETLMRAFTHRDVVFLYWDEPYGVYTSLFVEQCLMEEDTCTRHDASDVNGKLLQVIEEARIWLVVKQDDDTVFRREFPLEESLLRVTSNQLTGNYTYENWLFNT